jgi:phenylacetate-CoA ligase
MRRIIANAGIYFQDLLRGTSIIRVKKDLSVSQYWPDDKMHDYRNKKFLNLINHAVENVPYYTSLFNTNRIYAADIHDISDIRKLPILNKAIARNENNNLLTTLNIKNVVTGKTGGTTGVPLHFYKDAPTRSYGWGAYYRWYEWMGIKNGDRVLVIWGSPTVLSASNIVKLKKNIINQLYNVFEINSFSLNNSTLPGYVQQIIKFRPRLIRGYLSGILQLAEYIVENNITGIHPVAVSATTETVLPHVRAFIENAFCAPLYDQYGCGEVGSIAFECKEHKGLHINQEHVIVEVLDDNDNIIFDQPGRLLVTDLDNLVMPFIRYENGDLAIYSTKKCSCGVNQPLLAQISGRTADTIVIKDGSRVHGVFFTDILYELKSEEINLKIKRFQVYQAKHGEIEFRIETKDPIPGPYLISLENALLRFFNSVSIKVMVKLELEPSGKFKYIKTS